MYRKMHEELLRKSEQEKPLAKVHGGTAANISEFIQLRLLPAVIYVHIQKKCPQSALQILAKRIVEHSQTEPTRILMQHGKKGKFKYKVWISTQLMKTMTETLFFEKLLVITKERTRAVTIVIRQKIRRSTMHELWDSQYSFL